MYHTYSYLKKKGSQYKKSRRLQNFRFKEFYQGSSTSLSVQCWLVFKASSLDHITMNAWFRRVHMATTKWNIFTHIQSIFHFATTKGTTVTIIQLWNSICLIMIVLVNVQCNIYNNVMLKFIIHMNFGK